MSTLTLGIVVILYMFVIAWLGYIGYKQTKNASDYLLGGRKVNPIIMALSYGATFISASAIVGFGGVAATFGMGIQWLCLLNMFMGVVVAFIFFGRGTRKLGEQHNARTFPQLLGMHYKSRSIQIFIATIIFIGMPAVGKSSVGIVVAKRLGYRFVDTDLLIQEQEGKLLKEIIAEVGNEGFLKIENQVNRDVKDTRSVISPGGSVVYCQNENGRRGCPLRLCRL